MGSQSLKVITAATIGNSAYIEKNFCVPMNYKMGFEMMFNYTVGKPKIYIQLTGYNGTNYYTGAFLADFNLLKLYYFNSDWTPVELPVYDFMGPGTEYWMYMKLVIDWNLLQYMQAIFCGTIYNLSGLSLNVQSSSTKRYVDVTLGIIAQTNVAVNLYLDNFIFTQNE